MTFWRTIVLTSLILPRFCGRDEQPDAGLAAATAQTGTPSAGAPSTASASATGARTSPVCALVTEADVQAVLGVPIGKQPYNPMAGAGSTCNGNFTAAGEGGQPKQVLMVQDYADLELFTKPEKLSLTVLTPVQEIPPNMNGAEAKLFVARSGADISSKSLMLRKNGKLMVLQTYFKIGSAPPQLTKAQLLDLGKRVAAKM